MCKCACQQAFHFQLELHVVKKCVRGYRLWYKIRQKKAEDRSGQFQRPLIFQEEGTRSRDLMWNIMPNHVSSFLSDSYCIWIE